MNNAPIAVFDSGIGGLSVWRELRRGLPHESLIYYGDGKNCPYGDQAPEAVIGHVDHAVQRMLEEGAKMIVIACNTATAMAIDYLRATYPATPFIGLEPAVKPAAEATRSGVIGILATAATLRGRHFRESSERYSSQVRIVSAVGRGFVELVESNNEASPEAREVVRAVIDPMLAEGIDQLVLGCTHYPFLTEALREVIGDREVQLIDPSLAIQRRVESLLRELDLEAAPDHRPDNIFMTSGDETYRQRLIEKSNRFHP